MSARSIDDGGARAVTLAPRGEATVAVGGGPPRPRPYADPYLTGVGLGLVLLAAFLTVGRGLGVSGGVASVTSGVARAITPAAATNPYFASYLARDPSPWLAWTVIEILGMAIGGSASAALAGRLTRRVDRGAHASVTRRTADAALGGTLMGVGAVLARGCTSGQALTGGALLSVGSWTFMLAMFAAAYAATPLFRRAWR